MSDRETVMAEMELLGIGPHDRGNPSNSGAVRGKNGTPLRLQEAIAEHRALIAEISKMADQMTERIREVRETLTKADRALLKLESGLASLNTKGQIDG